jgi:hypothetical protein
VVRHVENMKEAYWKDWNENILASRVKKSKFDVKALVSGLLKSKKVEAKK